MSEDFVTTSLNERANAIAVERKEAKRGLEHQAEGMMATSNKKFKDAIVGQNVTIKVPEVDRGRNCPRNVMGVVLENLDNGLYRIGVQNGVLEKLFSRNEFQVCKETFITASSVPDAPASTLSLRKQPQQLVAASRDLSNVTAAENVIQNAANVSS